MNKFRIELWRIVKFLLITFAVNLVFSIISGSITNALAASPSAGETLSMLSYGYIFFNTLALTLLHRYFTFRATEKWYIAVPLMLAAAFAWDWLETLPLSAAASYMGASGFIAMIYFLSCLWMLASYLLQRCVIYCHTTDQNGWYRRFHPTDEEGA